MKIYNKILIVLILGLIPVSACDTDALVELNVNPNASTSIDWRFNMALAQLESCENRYVNWRANIIYSANLIQHQAGWNYQAGYTQTDFPSHSAAYFDTYYERALKEAAEVIRQTGSEGQNPEMTNTFNVTRIVYIIAMHRMVDLYGNVPYFEANRGIEGIFNPHYDDVKDIYTKEGIDEGGVRGGMLWELHEAAKGLSNPGIDDLSANDMIYQGDLEKWQKLAYSLMLRLAMRIQEVDKATSDKYIGIAVSSGKLILDASENAWCPMATGPNIWLNQNGYSRAMQPDDGGNNTVLGKPLVDLLMRDSADIADDDPRLMWISGGIGTWDDILNGTAETDPLKQWGMPNGLNQERLNAYLGLPSDTPTDYMVTFSRTNPKLLDYDEPYVIMTAGEVHLLLAEAALRGIAGVTDAQGHFEEGIRQDIKRYALHDASFVADDATINAYIASLGPVTLEEIYNQYYIATFMNHYEAWANWRRTGGFPKTVTKQDPPLPESISNGEIFRRLKYPTSESAVNPNYEAGAVKPNDFMTRIWWDVKQ